MKAPVIFVAIAFALAATLMFTASAHGDDPESVQVVISCDDCDELDGYEFEIGETTYRLILPTPTPTPTPTATPDDGFELLSDENLAKANVVSGKFSVVFNGRILTRDETANIREAFNQYLVAYFIHRCLANGYEYPPLSEQVIARWSNAEYVADASDNPSIGGYVRHFAKSGNPDYDDGRRNGIRSVYRIDDDLHIIAYMEVNVATCAPTSATASFRYAYALQDAETGGWWEMQWVYAGAHGNREGYWDKRRHRASGEHILDPLTNSEIESGNIRCRIRFRCGAIDNLDALRSLTSN